MVGRQWLLRPNIHRDLRLAIDGLRIETSETFAIDWVRIENGNIFAGDGKRVDQHYAFGADVLAVADGTVVSIRDGMPEEVPFQPPTAVHVPEDYGGNHVLLQIAPNVYAAYAHLQPGSVTVKVGDVVKEGALLGKLGNSGNSTAPHLHFGLLDLPDFFAGRSLPFVFDSFTVVGTVDMSVKESIKIVPASPRAVESSYPLYPGIHDYP
jgi:murein DD-endopeptidase MepM/ murein hydrolase activator NlpD